MNLSLRAKRSNLLSVLLTLLAVVGVFTTARPALADSTESYYDQIQTYGIVFAGICTGDTCACRDEGQCSLEDVMQVFVNISNFVIGISGSLVLGVFVFGAFHWLTSGGSAEKIDKGKKAMIGSVIGLFIIFGAFTAINFITGALRGGTAGQTNYCELVGPPTGKAGLGYACIDTTAVDESGYTCETGLCPGGTNIVCCIANEPTE